MIIRVEWHHGDQNQINNSSKSVSAADCKVAGRERSFLCVHLVWVVLPWPGLSAHQDGCKQGQQDHDGHQQQRSIQNPRLLDLLHPYPETKTRLKMAKVKHPVIRPKLMKVDKPSIHSDSSTATVIEKTRRIKFSKNSLSITDEDHSLSPPPPGAEFKEINHILLNAWLFLMYK